ncbi:hypothetical protein B0T19DRAFT_338554, partial [Cercophora scortea]
STVAERVQALCLHAVGKRVSEIEAVTGIKKEAFKQLLKRAKSRGYVVGDKIEDRFVLNAERSGRPKIIGEVEAKVILQVVCKDFDGRCSSTQEIADQSVEALKDIPGAHILSRRTILRW